MRWDRTLVKLEANQMMSCLKGGAYLKNGNSARGSNLFVETGGVANLADWR